MQKLNQQCLNIAVDRLTLDDTKTFLEGTSTKIASKIWHIFNGIGLFDVYMYAYNKEDLIVKFSKSKLIKEYDKYCEKENRRILVTYFSDEFSRRLRLTKPLCSCIPDPAMCVICKTYYHACEHVKCKHAEIKSLSLLTEEDLLKYTEWFLFSGNSAAKCEAISLLE